APCTLVLRSPLLSPSLLSSSSHSSSPPCLFFFFIHPAPPEISPLSLHDALPILLRVGAMFHPEPLSMLLSAVALLLAARMLRRRSEEHTSELQSLTNLVCRLLLEKKKKIQTYKSATLLKSYPPRNLDV